MAIRVIDDGWREYFKEETDDIFWLERQNIGHVHDSLKVEPKERDLWWLFKMYDEGKIASLTNFLQRPILKQLWGNGNYDKAKQYITSSFLGTSRFDGFIFVPISLIENEVNESLLLEQEGENPDQDVIFQLQEMLEELKQLRESGVVLLILDGQTRTQQGVVNFFKGVFALPSNGCKGKIIKIHFDDQIKVNEKMVNEVIVNRQIFSDLPAESKIVLQQTPIDTLVIVKGKINIVLMALIAKQQQERWTEFQNVILSQYCSAFVKKISDVLTAPVTDFLLKRTDVTGRTIYHEEKNGLEYYIAKMLYYMNTKSMVDVKDSTFANAFTPGCSPFKTNKEVNSLKKYIYNELLEWIGAPNQSFSDVKTSKGKLPRSILTIYIIFRNAMENPKKFFEAMQKYEIENNNKFIDYVMKKHLSLIQQYIPDTTKKPDKFNRYPKVLNTDSWDETIDPITNEKRLIKNPTGYVKSVEDALDSSEACSRVIEFLMNGLEADKDTLIKEQIIRPIIKMPGMEQTAVTSNFIDSDGDEMSAKDLLINNKYNQGHIKSKKRRGSNEAKNIIPQKEIPNKEYQDKPIVN